MPRVGLRCVILVFPDHTHFLFKHQAETFGVKCFSIFCGLIFADYKSGETLMSTDIIDLCIYSYSST